MSDHLAVLNPRLMIDIIICSWENMCKEQGKKVKKGTREGAGAGTRAGAKTRAGFDFMKCHII